MLSDLRVLSAVAGPIAFWVDGAKGSDEHGYLSDQKIVRGIQFNHSTSQSGAGGAAA